jgi:hypothetical protein
VLRLATVDPDHSPPAPDRRSERRAAHDAEAYDCDIEGGYGVGLELDSAVAREHQKCINLQSVHLQCPKLGAGIAPKGIGYPPSF